MFVLRTAIVDDEPISLKVMKMMLEGHENIQVVGTYTNPLKLLQEFLIVRPDCVFLDIAMRDLNGLELAEKLRDKNPKIAIYFVTAFNNYATQAFEINAIDYILKPVRPERLSKALEKISENRGLKKSSSQNRLKIRSFGTFEVFVGEEPITWLRAKPRELFAYLLQHEGKWVEKYKVCDALWREHGPDKALANLQTAVWAVRKTLREAGCTLAEVNYFKDRYQLNISDADWDLQQFDSEYQTFISSGIPEVGKKAISFYQGKYLSDEDWSWADIERESYKLKYYKLKRLLNNKHKQ